MNLVDSLRREQIAQEAVAPYKRQLMRLQGECEAHTRQLIQLRTERDKLRWLTTERAAERDALRVTLQQQEVCNDVMTQALIEAEHQRDEAVVLLRRSTTLLREVGTVLQRYMDWPDELNGAKFDAVLNEAQALLQARPDESALKEAEKHHG